MNSYDKMYIKEISNYRRFNDIERIAFEFLKHYEYYGSSKSSILQVFNTALDGSNNGYSKKQKEELLKDTIVYMKIKYNLIVKCETPLLMERKK